MKEQFTTNVINLKSYNISEADKIMVMYSKEKGIIRAVAKGNNLDTICQAEALNTFYKLRCDMNKLFYSMYCSEIVSNFGIENDPNSEEIFNLFYTFLETISNASTKEQIMLCVLKFQLKIMDITGYAIQLLSCVRCNNSVKNEEELYFSIEHGGILCAHCVYDIHKKIKIPFKIVEFLNNPIR